MQTTFLNTQSPLRSPLRNLASCSGLTHKRLLRLVVPIFPAPSAQAKALIPIDAVEQQQLRLDAALRLMAGQLAVVHRRLLRLHHQLGQRPRGHRRLGRRRVQLEADFVETRSGRRNGPRVADEAVVPPKRVQPIVEAQREVVDHFDEADDGAAEAEAENATEGS